MTSVIKISMPPEHAEEESYSSLMAKWRQHYEIKKKSGLHAHRAEKFARCLMAFQAPTQLYVSIAYIIPGLFSDYDEWTQYYLKVFIWFCCLEGLANYFCTILYDSSYEQTRDRPNLYGMNDRWNNPPDQFIPYDASHGQQNGHAVGMMPNQCDDGGIPWEYCESSKMYIPPRSHYCKVCKKCILKRDHHCYMVGTCIGFKNQRYFVILAFYAVVAGILGGYWTFSYLKNIYWPDAVSWTDFFLPVTFWRTVFGVIPLHVGIMIYHVHIEFLVGLIGFVYFTSQVTIIAQGKTLYELAQKVNVKNNNSINANFVSVFGNFYLLNFIFPMVLVLRQPEDGTCWEGVKLDYNANKEKKVTD